ncbi:SCO1860 family LAETG-anchored protein [Kitasatospora sp. NPDC050543]|uniref:SCO1860 family LAETG-anchored protein n=1 Tax=Kitasatospora sp. NPDC050543 TaxID=3364054 RepID=UPI00378C83C5
MLSTSMRVAAATLAVAAATLPASAAHASGAAPSATATPGGAPGAGKARAVTAELDLDVSLLNKAIDVPVNISLNEVETPAQRDGSVLTAKVDGVDQQGPVILVKADIGRSTTVLDAKGSSASVKLVNADVHAPGLPLTTLLGLEAMSAEVTCPVDGPPTAQVTAPAKLTVLGKPVTLSLYGPTKVEVPGIGSVALEFSKRSTTSATAAASALEAQVEVDPLNLNVAKVSGRISIASVSCEKPAGASSSASAAPGGGGPSGAPPTATASAAAVRPAAATGTGDARPAAQAPAAPSTAPSAHLAATGGSGATGPIAAGATALLVAGGGALYATRRRARARRH